MVHPSPHPTMILMVPRVPNPRQGVVPLFQLGRFCFGLEGMTDKLTPTSFPLCSSPQQDTKNDSGYTEYRTKPRLIFPMYSFLFFLVLHKTYIRLSFFAEETSWRHLAAPARGMELEVESKKLVSNPDAAIDSLYDLWSSYLHKALC